jgi:ABC-type polysaccharide/polyol phosphate export permease
MKTHIKNFNKYKELFIELIRQDIKLKYRNSFFGILWSMLNPLLVMIVLTIVFSTVFKVDIEYFSIYVLIGRIIYVFFAEATTFAMESIASNGSLIKKIYVPKYFFPLSKVFSTFITTAVTMIPLFIMVAFSGIPFHWSNFFIVLPLIYLLFVSIGAGLLLSAACVFFKDIRHFYSVLLLVVMYLTPIFYPASIIPNKYLVFIYANPLYYIVEMFRDVVMYGVLPSIIDNVILIFYSAFLVIIGLYTFKKVQDKFIYYI